MIYENESLKKAIDISLKFKSQKNFRCKTEIPIQKIINDSLPDTGTAVEKLIKKFEENYLPFCSNFSSPYFMGFPDAGNSLYGLIGSIFSDMLQQNLINSNFCSPIATLMEINVIQWLRNFVGYDCKHVEYIDDVGGIITAGGTMSNTIAMMLARESHKINTMITGVKNPDDFKVIIPKNIAHYSISSSLQWIGCGNNIIEVETAEYRYSISSLKKALKKYKGKIMAVVLYAGDSRTMTIEHIETIYNIVKNYDSTIWIHADACNGFCLSFSEKYKHLLNGIDKCDSITLDPHKMMQLTYTASCLLVRNPNALKLIKTKSDLIMTEKLAFGQITPFLGSKSWMSLKLWFAMRGLGKNGLEKNINNKYDLTQQFKHILMSSNDFVVLNEVQAFSICFMYIGNQSVSNINEINNINKLIYNEIMKEGIYYLHQFPLIDDKKVLTNGDILYPLRFFSGNEYLTINDIKQLIKYIRNKGKQIINKK